MSRLLRSLRLVLLLFLSVKILSLKKVVGAKIEGKHMTGMSGQQGHCERTMTTFTRNELIALNTKTKMDRRLKILHPVIVRRIRRLRLNKRGWRGGRKSRYRTSIEREINTRVFPKIVTDNGRTDVWKQIEISTLNARSIKNKLQSILSYIYEEKIDLCVITETWLDSTEADQVWLSSQGIQDVGVKMDIHNRQGKRGGGLALIFNDRIKLGRMQELSTDTFEAKCWEMKVNIWYYYHNLGNLSPTIWIAQGEYSSKFSGSIYRHDNRSDSGL